MSLLQKMKALQVAKVKPRYVLVDGEWVPKTEPVEAVKESPKPVEGEAWPTCGSPKVGLPCPKCKGTTDVVFHDARVNTCHWCTDGAKLRKFEGDAGYVKGDELAKITPADKRNFDRRVMKGLAMCFLKTVA